MTRALHEDSDWLSQLAMALCFERFLESTSRFGPYLKTLNERFSDTRCANWEEKEKMRWGRHGYRVKLRER